MMKREDIEEDVTEEPKNELNSDFLPWPEKDILQLLHLIEKYLPVNDRMTYKSRAKKLPWDKISFGDYSQSDCEIMWDDITHKLRRFRLLKELLIDAHVWLKHPWTNYASGKSFKHPNRPKKARNPIRIFMKEHNTVRQENPNLSFGDFIKLMNEKYNALSSEEKQKYINLSQLEKEEYNKNLKVFLHENPSEASSTREKKIIKRDCDEDFRYTAFKIYLDEQIVLALKKCDLPLTDLITLYNKKWDDLDEKSKLTYLDLAKRKEIEESDTKIKKRKRIGKPNAYNIFVSKVIKSEKFQNIPITERLKKVSQLWKDLSEEERKNLIQDSDQNVINDKEGKKRKIDTICENYEEQHADTDNIIRIKKKQRKKNVKDAIDNGEVIKKESNESNVEPLEYLNSCEQKPPPEEPILLFKLEMKKQKVKYKTKEELSEAWNNLPKSERKAYKRRLKNMKTEYNEKLYHNV